MKNERGVAILELAVLTPFLLVMIMSLGEFGRAYYQYNLMNKSVRNGARFVAENVGSASAIDSATKSSAQSLVVYGSTSASSSPLLDGWRTSEVSVGQVSGDPDYVLVSATYNYAPVWGLNFSLMFNASVAMRVL